LLLTSNAKSQGTGIAQRANIFIVARSLVEEVQTSEFGVAGVAGTNLFIVALRERGVNALASLAMVAEGAGISIIATGFVGDMLARPIVAADIVTTRVSVIAVGRGTGHTLAARALVIQSARIAVIAGSRIVVIETAQFPITTLRRTRVLVVTGQQASPRLATATSADISCRTGIAIIANRHVVFMNAAGLGVAPIVGAEVAIVAREHPLSGKTKSSNAAIVQSADITIIARRGVVQMSTAGCRVAGVVGALVAVITIRFGTRQTETRIAEIANGALVAIVTKGSIVGCSL